MGVAARVSTIAVRARTAQTKRKAETISIASPHQADGVAFLISKGRAILGDEKGADKAC
jgi:hypothetical protein